MDHQAPSRKQPARPTRAAAAGTASGASDPHHQDQEPELSLRIPVTYQEVLADDDHALSAVTSRDVLTGRGAKVNNHAGNRHYRQLIADYSSLYSGLDNRDKPLVARRIVYMIRQRGGRFLRVQLQPLSLALSLDDANADATGDGSRSSSRPASSSYFEIGDAAAQAKTSQALRSNTHRIRKQEQQEYIATHYPDEDPGVVAATGATGASSPVAPSSFPAIPPPPGEPPEIEALFERAKTLRAHASLLEQEAYRLRWAHQEQQQITNLGMYVPNERQEQGRQEDSVSSDEQDDKKRPATTTNSNNGTSSSSDEDPASRKRKARGSEKETMEQQAIFMALHNYAATRKRDD